MTKPTEPRLTTLEVHRALMAGAPIPRETAARIALDLIDARAELEEWKSVDKGEISDGFHTFNELYEHRFELYLALCEQLFWGSQGNGSRVWCSLKHADGTMYEGMFVLGIDQEPGRQITYRLPISYWDRAKRCSWELLEAPEYDGHTPNDVLARLQRI